MKNKQKSDGERKSPGRPPSNLQIDLQVEFVPVSEEDEPKFKAGIRWLLGLLHEARDEYEKERANQNDDK